MSFGWVTLVATPKSHEFEERRIKVNSSDDPVKIGRAVARIQASPENAVFDCKVLSRNHAILWYRDGEFWLKDTKSSNGTFVNNEKLQQTGTGRDTDVRRVFSGDIIQLGVEIVENSNKVAYGCIYAVINCFNSDGKLIENTGPIIDEGQRTINTLVSNRKLFQMQQYVSEAQHREKQREDKITELMSIIVANEKAAETAWKALVNEDRLLARIESLEAQLSVLSNNNNPDQQKEELLKMIDEKTKFEAMTKEMIRRLIEENGETTSRLKDMEQSLETTELTYQQLRSKNEDLELALAETTELNDLKATELEQATADLVEKQKVLTTYEEKLADLQQKNLKLSKVSVVNETASGLSRLLATAINNGSFIDEPELHLLINTLKSASYLPPHSREASIAESSSASESELRTQLNNGYATTSNSEPVTADEKRQQEDKTTIEVYLKTILELQAKNRELELAISSKWENQENMENLENSNTHFLEDACSKEPLEMSPTGNTSFFPLVENVQDSSSSASPQGVKKPSSIVKETDGVESVMLLVSLVPLLAFIMSVIAPIQRRFSTNTVKKEE